MAQLAELAEGALLKALAAKQPLEVHLRLKALLEDPEVVPSAERLRELRSIEVLEKIGTPEASQLLRELAGGAPGARLTVEAMAALARLEALDKKRVPARKD